MDKKNTTNFIEKHWMNIIVAFTIFQLTINVFACILYILSKLAYNIKIDDYTNTKWIGITELIVSGYFSIEITWNFYHHPKPKYKYFLMFDTWIDL